MGVINVLAFLLCIVLVCSNPTPTKDAAASTVYRLPTEVLPSKYTLVLTFPDTAFDQNGNQFEGSVTIEYTNSSQVKEIKLHASSSYITVNKVTVAETAIDSAKYSIDSTTDILTINVDGLDIPETILVIEYNGTISNTDNYGIYKSSYAKSATETVYLLATQFEPTYARRAFPCFDEPFFKAIYDVTVKYPSTKSLKVLFNTDKTAEPEKISESQASVTFKTTPKMSSYVFALVLSDFTSEDNVTVPGDTTATHAVWSRASAQASRAYAESMGPKIIQKLNDYTGRAYITDMEKIDQIALPDLAAGAMENWGLVTYREKYLLANPDGASATSQKTIATTVAHELAHQWFGNLITCNWWSVTFLNEGFATYFGYFIPHQVNANWQLDKQFVVDVVQQVLQSDAADAQALDSEVNTPAEILGKFGDISYSKGGSIVRMVNHIMGETQFKQGIQEYFKKDTLLLSTSTPDDLWDVLDTKVNKDVSIFPKDATLKSIMQNWVKKPGYPLLTVSLDGNTLKVSQEPFLIGSTDIVTQWSIPITYAESASKTKFQDTKPASWLTNNETTITLKNENNDWVILNTLQTGYYRVNYDDNLWTKITAALQKDNFDEIVDLNRAQIVDDLFNLAKAGTVQYSDVFKRIAFLKGDREYYPWVPAMSGFNYMMQRIPKGNDLRPHIETQLLDLMEALYKNVSFTELDDDNQVETLKQVLTLNWACNLGKEDCVTKAKESYTEFKSKGTKLNKNLKGVIYCTVLKNGKDDDYTAVRALYDDTDIAAEKLVILSSLGCSNSRDKLKGLLEETIADSSSIKGQDALSAFLAVLGGSEDGVDVALEFFSNNLNEILNKYTTMGAQKALVSNIGAKLTNSTHIEKFKALVESATFPTDLKSDGQKSVEQAKSNVQWLKDHQSDLAKFYDSGDDPTPGGANAIRMNAMIFVLVAIMSILGFLRT